jgi:hemerythrin-like domain-containing protein
MQEHGVLERVLLVYEEAARRIEGARAVDLAVVGAAAGLVQRFVEGYHERQEEEVVFPRLEEARREVELVKLLRLQHQRGRAVTADIVRLCTQPAGQPLTAAIAAFSRMYRPHAAREDTVLIPAFRELVGDPAYRELGESLEEREHAVLGPAGFEGAVAEVARLEVALGIDDLATFTP